MPIVTGTFTVDLRPVAPEDKAAGSTFNRLAIEKQYRGPLEAVALGQMLSVLTPVSGSAGYVAVERVNGQLDGRAGSFALQHSGLMDQGSQDLTIAVVPGSGTAALTGLRGRMGIRIEDGQHYYDFDYTLPE